MTTTARTIGISAPEPLEFLFRGDLERFSFLEDKHGECSQVTLWFGGRDMGVTLWGEMHNVAFRLEVSVLNMRIVASDPDSSSEVYPKEGTPRSETLSPPLAVKSLWKLNIQENELKCESGLRLLLSDESELIILPSAFPCHVAPIRDGRSLTGHPTEYKYTDYEQELIF